MIPAQIGRYHIERELGRGGMAVVYLGHDPLLMRPVAVKVLPHQLTFESSFRARFEREAQVVAGLAHPHIIPLLDYGEHEGQPFLVLRYLPGGSLADRLERGPLGPSELAPIVTQVAAALDHAHARQVIHRDLKPDNILFDDDGLAYLADFGMAKLVAGSSSLTGSAILGTPDYLSPEQARGLPDLDGRSDVYTLGAVVFHALAGRPPYLADTPMGMVVAHLTEPVPDILAASPALPAACQRLVERAMAKAPGDRYPTPGELAAALTDIAAGESGLAGELAAPAGGRLMLLGAARVEELVLEGHAGEATCLAFSPDSRLLASGGDDRLILLRSLTDPVFGRVMRTLRGHVGMVAAVAFSPDGRLLASGGHGDTSARLWDLASGRLAASLAQDSWVGALAFDPLGRWLVTGNNYGQLRRWEVAPALRDGPVEGQTLQSYRGYLADLAFSPDGRTLAVAGGPPLGLRVELWDTDPPRLRQALRDESAEAWENLHNLAISPDGRLLAAGGFDLRVWETDSGRLVWHRAGGHGALGMVAFSPDSRVLVAAWYDSTLDLWDMHSGERLAVLDDPGILATAARDLAFSPDGRWFALAGRDGSVRLWRLR